MSKTKIEWCDHTINPIIGCTKCSPGCDNCYAEKMAIRLAGHAGKLGERYQEVVHLFLEHGKGWNGSINVDLSCFVKLPVTGKPLRVFVGSMGDVFHETIPVKIHIELFERLQSFPQHTFMLLTKRPGRMRSVIKGLKLTGTLTGSEGGNPFPVWPLPNAWLGVTVCNQQEADEKIPLLLSTPAAKRFVSVEPMLGEVNLQKAYPEEYHHCEECGWHGPGDACPYVCSMCDRGDFPGWDGDGDMCKNGHDGYGHRSCPRCGNNGDDVFSIHDVHELHEGDFDFPGLDWVICGGETGSGARPMNPNWVRSLRDQCQEAGVPFFFKQWASKKPKEATIDGREWKEFPE